MKYVYFMKPRNADGPIKVGCSEFPKERLVALSISTRIPLELMTFAVGGFSDENTVHEIFAEYRAGPEFLPSGAHLASCGASEWFEAAPFVLEFIGKVSESGELPFPVKYKPPKHRGFAREFRPETVKDLILHLGGPSMVATHMKVDKSVVHNWARCEVPQEYKGALAILAAHRAMHLPKGFWQSS